MQPIGIQHMNSRKCSPNARKSIAFEKTYSGLEMNYLPDFPAIQDLTRMITPV